MYPVLQNKKKLREILLPLWGQKGIKFHETVLLCFGAWWKNQV